MNRPIASASKIKALRRAGWTVEDIGRNRLRWTSPTHEIVYSGKNVRDCRSVKNHAARLKRAAQPHSDGYN